MEVEKRVGLVEEAILQMKDLRFSHKEQLDDFYSAMRRSRDNFKFKMNALSYSQIKTEAELKELKGVYH